MIKILRYDNSDKKNLKEFLQKYANDIYIAQEIHCATMPYYKKLFIYISNLTGREITDILFEYEETYGKLRYI